MSRLLRSSTLGIILGLAILVLVLPWLSSSSTPQSVLGYEQTYESLSAMLEDSSAVVVGRIIDQEFSHEVGDVPDGMVTKLHARVQLEQEVVGEVATSSGRSFTLQQTVFGSANDLFNGVRNARPGDRVVLILGKLCGEGTDTVYYRLNSQSVFYLDHDEIVTTGRTPSVEA